MNSRYWSILGLGLCAMNFSHSTFAGSESGGGGNGYAILVAEEASKITQELKSLPLGELHDINPTLFEMAVKDTKLSVSNELTLDGAPVDAINYPEDHRIIFSIPAIDRLKGTREFTVLVLHEYLGIMRINDQSYITSRPVVDFIIANPPHMSYREGFEHINCKIFREGHEVAGESATPFHGVDILSTLGFDWYAYFNSGMLDGERRLFFKMEVIDKKTKKTVASMEIPANVRIEAILKLSDEAKMYCWVTYLTQKN